MRPQLDTSGDATIRRVESLLAVYHVEGDFEGATDCACALLTDLIVYAAGGELNFEAALEAARSYAEDES